MPELAEDDPEQRPLSPHLHNGRPGAPLPEALPVWEYLNQWLPALGTLSFSSATESSVFNFPVILYIVIYYNN